MRFLFTYLTFLLPLLVSSTGCAMMVGGPCEYETIIGTAVIVRPQNGKPFARFELGKQRFPNSKIHLSRGSDFALREPVGGQVGDRYPAALSAITKGSCTPLSFWLLTTEYRTSGQLVSFDKDGKLSSAGNHKIAQIAAAFKKIFPTRQQLTLNVCGQTSSDGTDEYNLMLGERYARQVSTQLVALGVSAAQINSYSAGENPCPHSAAFDDELANGVWISFILADSKE